MDRLEVLGRPDCASVLLLDDTWVSGASAQSAAAALKLAGARHVAVVVLGRHVNPADPASAALLDSLHPARYDPSICAVHRSVP
jgi:orotate phosphoribosyltransferase